MADGLEFIRGDDFALDIAIVDDAGEPADLTGETWRSQLRTPAGHLVADLSIEVTAPTQGRARLTAPASETRFWPVGQALGDIEFTRAGRTASSRRFSITVLEDVTR